MRLAAVLLAATICQQTPAFRSGVQLVEVDARVFDGQGRFVDDLRLEEFEILEDGRPQPIQTMFLVRANVPGEAPTASTGAVRPRAPQTWIFVFDRKHLMPGGYRRAKVAVDAFMAERFRAGDLAGIVADEKMVDNRITPVRAEFLATLAKVKVPGDALERSSDAAEAAVTGGSGEAGTGIREALRYMNAVEVERAARDTTQLLDELARGLTNLSGPKTIVLMSDGWPLGKLEETLRATVANLNAAGARVYALDTRGLAGPPPDTVNSLAIDTGGMALFNINNLGPALDQIAADTNTYYVLGYQSTAPRGGRKARSLEVRVTRPGVTVRARKGIL